MQDSFDLDLLLQDDAVNDGELRRAVAATFERRRSPLPADLPVGLSDAFGADAGRCRQWAAFLRKNRLDATDLAALARRRREHSARIGIPTP